MLLLVLSHDDLTKNFFFHCSIITSTSTSTSTTTSGGSGSSSSSSIVVVAIFLVVRWPNGSRNARLAGKPLAGGYRGCLWSLIGDLDYLVSILKLPNFNSARPCSLCRCSLAGTKQLE